MNDRSGSQTVVASPRPPTVQPGYDFVLWMAPLQ
jgi:hypothetical protein